MAKVFECILSDLYRNQVPALQHAVAELRKKANRNVQTITILQEKVNELTENGVDSDDTINSCNCANELSSIKQTLQDCQSQLSTINSTIAQYETSIHNLGVDIESHGITIDSHGSSIDGLYENYNLMNTNVNDLTNKVNEVDVKVIDVDNKVIELDNRVNELTEKVDANTSSTDTGYTPEQINCFATYVEDTTKDFRDNAQAHYIGYDMHVYKPTQWDKYDEERSKEKYVSDPLEISNIYINPKDDSIYIHDFVADFVAKVQERTNVIAECGLTLHLRRYNMETCPHESQYDYMVAWLKLLEWTSRVIIYADDDEDSIKVDPETLAYEKHPIGTITIGRFPISSTSRVKTIEVNNTDHTQIASITMKLIVDADNNETDIDLALEEIVFPETVRGIDLRLHPYVMYSNEQRIEYLPSTDYQLNKVTSNINTLYFPTHCGYINFSEIPHDKLENIFFPPLADEIMFQCYDDYTGVPERIKVHREAFKAEKNGKLIWGGVDRPTLLKREFPDSA